MPTLGLWLILQNLLDKARREERGDVVNWLIIVLGVAVAASAVVLVLRPAIESAGTSLTNYLQ